MKFMVSELNRFKESNNKKSNAQNDKFYFKFDLN